jgi:integrase
LVEYGQLDSPKQDTEEIITFGEVTKLWAAEHKKEVKYSTWPDYVSAMNGHILPIFKDVPIAEITYLDVIRFRNRLKVGSKRANNILVPMRCVFNFACLQKIISHNVMKDIKRRSEEASEIHPFTFDEIYRILDVVNPWYRPYVIVAFFTGMRAGEQNGLQWPDFKEEMKPIPQVFIHRTFVYKKDGPTKTKKSKRYIDCLPQVLAALKEQQKLTGNKKHIFLTVDGRRMTPDHLRKEVWMPALEKAGLEYRPPMQTRHTFATMMISAGEDIGWVKNMLGHSSLQMIFQHYFTWMPKETRSDGQAFMRHIENESTEAPKSDKVCTDVVPFADYKNKKGAGN